MAKVFVMMNAINDSEYYVRATTVLQVAVTAWESLLNFDICRWDT